MDLKWTFGDRLRKVRIMASLSTRELGALLGVSHTAVTGWESDIHRPRELASLAVQVERVTGASAEWLLFGCCDEGCKHGEVGKGYRL